MLRAKSIFKSQINLNLLQLLSLIVYNYLRQGGYVFTSLCLFVCLSVNRFTQKLISGFAPKLVERSQIYPGSSIKIWDLSGLNSGSQIQMSVISGVHMWRGGGMHSTECPSSLRLELVNYIRKIVYFLLAGYQKSRIPRSPLFFLFPNKDPLSTL